MTQAMSRLLKNGHLLRFPHPSPCQSTGQACCSVQPSTPQADSPTRRRGKKSLLIRRDATLRISGALQLALFEQPGKDDFLNSLLDFAAIRFGIPLAIIDLFGRGCES
jgi:hypothetical protein